MELFKKQKVEHQLSYMCKICSKILVSGRALGGHMRVQAPVSDAEKLTETEFKKSRKLKDSDDESIKVKDANEGLDVNGRNLRYAIPRNPKHSLQFPDRADSFLLDHEFDSESIDSSIISDPWVEEFSSWKGLFGHMKCYSETHEDSGDAHLQDSQKHETRDKENDRSECDAEIEIDRPSWNSSRFDKLTKGKRSKRCRYAAQLNPLEQFGSSTNNESDAETVIDNPSEKSSKFDKWMKGKGFKRSRYAPQFNPLDRFGSSINTEEEDMALCLVMLASGVNTAQSPQFQMGAEKPGSGDLKLPNAGSQLPKCIRKKSKYRKIDAYAGLYNDDQIEKTRYKFNTCNKVFHSHQALGGHRASHNKECFPPIEEENQSQEEEISEELHIGLYSQLLGNFHKPLPKERTKDSCIKARNETKTMEAAAISGKNTPRVHECSICYRVFASGQALGGHKRCHWVSAETSGTTSTISSNKETPMQQQMPARVELLDLNLPAPLDDDCDDLTSNPVDSHGASHAHSHRNPYWQSWLMSMRCPKQGRLSCSNNSHLNKHDEAGSKEGNWIGQTM